MLRQITDGFSMDTKLLPLIGYYRTAAISQLNILRRSGSFQCQWLVIPQESSEGIPGYGQIEYQASATPGSWIWGYSLKATLAGSDAPSLVHVSVEDEGTGQFMESDYEVGSALAPFDRDTDNRGQMPIPLVQIIPVTSPGHLNVRIANQSATTIYAQFILNVARICKGRMIYPQECVPV